MLHLRLQNLVVGASLIGILASQVIWAETDSDVQSRGFKLPSVSVPPPPPPPPPPSMHGLTIRTIGDGSGTVPLPPAAACPPTCAAQYPQGTPIMLAPVPAPGSMFAGWGGDCQGTGPCALRMDRPRNVEARFNKIQAPTPTTPSYPDIAKTPSPGGPIPIPYPNIGAAPLGPELTSISRLMADGTPMGAVLDAWKAYVTRQVQAKRPLNVRDTILQVQRQAEAQVRARTEAQKVRLADKLNSAGEDAQLANIALQNILQKETQTLQMMSNMSKAMHDAAMAIIGKSGG